MPTQESLLFVVPGDLPPQIQDSPQLERLKPYGELVLYTDRPSGMKEQLERVMDAHIIINTRAAVQWRGEALKALPKLRMITTCSIGTDMIDLEVASELGIVVSNQPGRIAGVVAEHALGLLLAVAKRAVFQTTELRSGRWTRLESIYLQGKTLGIVGTGNTGREMARLAKALRMDVIAWTYHPSAERAAELGVTYVELDELLSRSDVVSLHVRLSDESREIIGKRELALMKRGSILVNIGRGELVNTEGLVAALDSGHLAGAGLDVFDVEPLPADHPLLSCQQVALTPHSADHTPEGIDLLNEGAVDNVLAYLSGTPQNVVS